MEAVKQNGFAIVLVENPNINLCLAALTNNNFKYIGNTYSNDIITYVEYQIICGMMKKYGVNIWCMDTRLLFIRDENMKKRCVKYIEDNNISLSQNLLFK